MYKCQNRSQSYLPSRTFGHQSGFSSSCISTAQDSKFFIRVPAKQNILGKQEGEKTTHGKYIPLRPPEPPTCFARAIFLFQKKVPHKTQSMCQGASRWLERSTRSVFQIHACCEKLGDLKLGMWSTSQGSCEAKKRRGGCCGLECFCPALSDVPAVPISGSV